MKVHISFHDGTAVDFTADDLTFGAIQVHFLTQDPTKFISFNVKDIKEMVIKFN